jgi:hypothetical protein
VRPVVVVIAGMLADQPQQMPFAQHHDVVEELSP